MNRMRNLVHWKVMILLAIVIWIGVSKVAASADPDEVKEHKREREAPLHVVGEAKSNYIVKDDLIKLGY